MVGWRMDAAYISAVSALAGSVIGGLTATLTTWLGQRSQARAGQIAHDLARREDLIRDFIIAASKTYGDAIVNNEAKMPEIIDLYAMISRMRVLEMPQSVDCADEVMRSILETYSAPNRTVADLRELVKSGGGVSIPCGISPRRRARSCVRLSRADSRLREASSRRGLSRIAVSASLYVITVGALRPVRFSISASDRESAMRSASAAWVS